MAEELEKTQEQQHAELERERRELEGEAVRLSRENLKRAAEIEKDLLDRIADTKMFEQLPQALRAIADSKAKNVNNIAQLTGRVGDQRPESDLGTLLQDMAKKGYLRLNVQVGPQEPAVEGTAEEEPGK